MVEYIEHMHVLGGPIIRTLNSRKPLFMLDIVERKYYTMFEYGMLPPEDDVRSLMLAIRRDMGERGEYMAGLEEISSVQAAVPVLKAYNLLLARHALDALSSSQKHEPTLRSAAGGLVAYSVHVGKCEIRGVAPEEEVEQRIADRVREILRVARLYWIDSRT